MLAAPTINTLFGVKVYLDLWGAAGGFVLQVTDRDPASQRTTHRGGTAGSTLLGTKRLDHSKRLSIQHRNVLVAASAPFHFCIVHVAIRSDNALQREKETLLP